MKDICIEISFAKGRNDYAHYSYHDSLDEAIAELQRMKEEYDTSGKFPTSADNYDRVDDNKKI